MEEQKKIRVIFTPKTDYGVSEIIKTFNLQESPGALIEKSKKGKESNITIINLLARDLAMQRMSDKEMTISLQKDLGVSAQVAEQISKQIADKVVPFFEKVEEEKLKDDNFVNALSKKIWGEEKSVDNTQPIVKKPELSNVAENEKKPIATTKPVSAQPTKKTKQPAQAVEEKSKIFERPIQQERPKQSGPDGYREPIE